jgi:hypothetical protein
MRKPVVIATLGVTAALSSGQAAVTVAGSRLPAGAVTRRNGRWWIAARRSMELLGGRAWIDAHRRLVVTRPGPSPAPAVIDDYLLREGRAFADAAALARAVGGRLIRSTDGLRLEPGGAMQHAEIAASVTVSPDPAALGAPVTFRFIVTNASSRPAAWTLPSGQQAEFVVRRAGQTVWRYSEGMMFTQALTTFRVGAGTSRRVEATWNGRARDGAAAPPGAYEVVATLATQRGTSGPSAMAAFSIR